MKKKSNKDDVEVEERKSSVLAPLSVRCSVWTLISPGRYGSRAAIARISIASCLDRN